MTVLKEQFEWEKIVFILLIVLSVSFAMSGLPKTEWWPMMRDFFSGKNRVSGPEKSGMKQSASFDSKKQQTGAWILYKNNFIAQNGRVVDTGNGGISHSEGQGYGMLLATYFDDPVVFQKMWHWTKANLQRQNDYLFSWRYEQGIGITDKNNASDGDILIAWALVKAGKKWSQPNYLKQAKNILIDIRNKLICQWQKNTILLPGEFGFSTNGYYTINLSYWVYPAFSEFRTVDPSPLWDNLIESGLDLQKKACFGNWHMPPDWLDLKEEMMISVKYKAVSGYDAIRIPLYQLWDRRITRDYSQKYLAFQNFSRQEKGYLSPEINLINNQLANYEASNGIKAVFDLQQAFISKKPYAPLDPLVKVDNYYSSTLYLLAAIAAQETNL